MIISCFANGTIHGNECAEFIRVYTKSKWARFIHRPGLSYLGFELCDTTFKDIFGIIQFGPKTGLAPVVLFVMHWEYI